MIPSYSPDEYRVAIREIADRLDRLRPGWRRSINRATLDMAIPWQCVLGQIFGGWERGLKILDLPFMAPHDTDVRYSVYTLATSRQACWKDWLRVIGEEDLAEEAQPASKTPRRVPTP